MTVINARRGRNILLTPGPTNLPEAVLAAMQRNAVDLGREDFVTLARGCIDDLRPLFRTEGEAFLYIANGHGAWEAVLVNLLAPGEQVLVAGDGHFSRSWANMAESLGYRPEQLPGDWRHPVDPEDVAARLSEDRDREIKAVLLVHTDTATGITSDVAAVRAAIDSADHPALLLVDAVASLATTEFRMDDWGVDAAVAASQKALMTPPGLGFVAVNERALAVAACNPTPRNYWDFQRRRSKEGYTWFCGTAPEHLLFGLRAALDLLAEEGLEQAFARHARLARASRAAIKAWSEAGALELNTLVPEAAAASVSVIRTAEGIDADRIKRCCYERFNVSLGSGLGQLDGRAFRIGHMGDLNEANLLGGLAAIEAALRICEVPHGRNGVTAAVEALVG